MIKIGTDIELFLALNNKVISAIPFCRGTKENPILIPNANDNRYKFMHDNVTMEFNVPEATDPDEFSSSIVKAKTLIKEYLDNSFSFNVELKALPSAIMDRRYLMDSGALEFGCEPDYNAWTLETNPKPCATNNKLRSAGGHIHIGYEEPNIDDSLDIIKAMDIFLGVPSILKDKDKRRRKLYGKAGAYRVKDYGVEYRTLSNFWVADESLMQSVFSRSMKAATLALTNKDFISELNSFKKEITSCINKGDEDLALELMDRFQVEQF